MTESNTFKKFVNKLIDHDILSAARLLEGLADKEASEILENVSPNVAARILKNLQISYAAALPSCSRTGWFNRACI